LTNAWLFATLVDIVTRYSISSKARRTATPISADEILTDKRAQPTVLFTLVDISAMLFVGSQVKSSGTHTSVTARYIDAAVRAKILVSHAFINVDTSWRIATWGVAFRTLALIGTFSVGADTITAHASCQTLILINTLLSSCIKLVSHLTFTPIASIVVDTLSIFAKI